MAVMTPPACCRTRTAHGHWLTPFVLVTLCSSRALIDLPRQDGGELVGEPLQALRLLVHLGRKLVVENRRRYGGDEADCGCKQRFCNARRDHLQRRVALGGNGLEAR